MRDQLARLLADIKPVDKGLAPAGQAHLDDLTKPRGSLGRLEEIALKLWLIAGGTRPAADPARVYTIAGDHGVAASGVSLFPQEVTRQMVLNFVGGGAAINVMTRTAGVDLKVVDAGCLGTCFPEHASLVQRKVAQGTADMSQGPAMTEDECLRALALGADLAAEAAAEGYRALGTGDMGIANTTPSTALYSAFLGIDPVEITGPGTGLDAGGVSRKAEVIRQSLAVNRAIVDGGDPVAILAALGGLEIAALAGLILGAAAHRMAVAVDGFISTAAYVSAWKICPAVADYCFLSHASAEPGHRKVVAALGQRPLLDLDMRLGEGTGSALALVVMRMAANVFNEMATFSQAGVSSGS